MWHDASGMAGNWQTHKPHEEVTAQAAVHGICLVGGRGRAVRNIVGKALLLQAPTGTQLHRVVPSSIGRSRVGQRLRYR